MLAGPSPRHRRRRLVPAALAPAAGWVISPAHLTPTPGWVWFWLRGLLVCLHRLEEWLPGSIELRVPVLVLALLVLVPVPRVLLGLPVDVGVGVGVGVGIGVGVGGGIVVALIQVVLGIEKAVTDSGIVEFQKEVDGVVFQSL